MRLRWHAVLFGCRSRASAALIPGNVFGQAASLRVCSSCTGLWLFCDSWPAANTIRGHTMLTVVLACCICWQGGA